ncbi:hypothetical protein [Parabacteroides sp. Marseille-P3160]|uniref:hypothetical protein n=1 Tax=Parabacteroides sp. Marseille-P3160 TaxID=1917887 RepID=UPI0009BA7FAF|nr:hypothetical protein [Parabacteroides sp. Marseille-P3160]
METTTPPDNQEQVNLYSLENIFFNWIILFIQKNKYMKTKKIRLNFLLFPFTLLVIGGCNNDNYEKNPIFPEAIIVKELPKMYLSGNIEKGDHKVIQDQSELQNIFSWEELSKVNDLQNIDFSKYTLLIGCDSYLSEANLEYSYSKTGDIDYLFQIRISGMAARPDGFFQYGIIVEKLPQKAKVNFSVTSL